MPPSLAAFLQGSPLAYPPSKITCSHGVPMTFSHRSLRHSTSGLQISPYPRFPEKIWELDPRKMGETRRRRQIWGEDFSSPADIFTELTHCASFKPTHLEVRVDSSHDLIGRWIRWRRGEWNSARGLWAACGSYCHCLCDEIHRHPIGVLLMIDCLLLMSSLITIINYRLQ